MQRQQVPSSLITAMFRAVQECTSVHQCHRKCVLLYLPSVLAGKPFTMASLGRGIMISLCNIFCVCISTFYQI